MKKLIVNISNYTNYQYYAFLDRGTEIDRPNDTVYEIGQVVYEIDNNCLGVVLGCIDYSYGEIRTDMNGMRSMDTVRPATMEDFNIKGVRFLPRLKSECEGKKTFRLTHNVGKVKYLLSYHDGVKTHKDGSKFFDIETFSNKQKLNKFVSDLKKEGYTSL